jgi:hypothetical protein
MDWLISEDLAREVGEQFQRMNRGYWAESYWETQDDGAAMLVRITINDEQNNEENITAICWILRTVLATLLPSRPEGTMWVGAIVPGSPLNHVVGSAVAWPMTGERLACMVGLMMTNLDGRCSDQT